MPTVRILQNCKLIMRMRCPTRPAASISANVESNNIPSDLKIMIVSLMHCATFSSVPYLSSISWAPLQLHLIWQCLHACAFAEARYVYVRFIMQRTLHTFIRPTIFSAENCIFVIYICSKTVIKSIGRKYVRSTAHSIDATAWYAISIEFWIFIFRFRMAKCRLNQV